MPLLGENAIRFKASESDRMDVASPIAARMRKAAILTAQATSFDDFERLDPEISAGDTLINFGQQADFCIWQGLETRAQRHLLRNRTSSDCFHAGAGVGLMSKPRAAARRLRAAMLRWRCCSS